MTPSKRAAEKLELIIEDFLAHPEILPPNANQLEQIIAAEYAKEMKEARIIVKAYSMFHKEGHGKKCKGCMAESWLARNKEGEG